MQPQSILHFWFTEFILHFWFTEFIPEDHFAKNATFDQAIRPRFGAAQAVAARCD